MFLHAHLAQRSERPRDEKQDFFSGFQAALEFIMRHPETEITPPEYPPIPCVSL